MWLVQPIKLSSATGRCAGRGCALVRQLANCTVFMWLISALPLNRVSYFNQNSANADAVSGFFFAELQADGGSKLARSARRLSGPDAATCGRTYIKPRWWCFMRFRSSFAGRRRIVILCNKIHVLLRYAAPAWTPVIFRCPASVVYCLRNDKKRT